MAITGFEFQKKRVEKTIVDKTPLPTVSSLLDHKVQKKCHSCTKLHPSEKCLEAKKWSLSERKQKLIAKGCCYLCLKFGHIARKCRVNVTCSYCKGKHVQLMCPKIDGKPSQSTLDNYCPEIQIEESLSNHTYSKVFLQTVAVRLNGNNKSKTVRVLFDTGSHKSYITHSAVAEMEYASIKEEQIIHSLFGGSNTEIINHKTYRVRASSLNNQYCCNFEALDQFCICNDISCVKPGPWIQELSVLGIELTDGPISVLIGSDIAAKLFTGKRHVLSCGLVVLETLFGWTLSGKTTISNAPTLQTSSMLVTSLINKNFDITDMWNLDILGISDPAETKSRRDIEDSVRSHFLKTVRVQEDGRYEVSMPWIEGHPTLPDNSDLARKRLENLLKKLNTDGYYKEYDAVFKDWLDEGIIERLSESDLMKLGYYLPHRHVVKLSSATTKIRPVFDASARVKNCPSLNQCIEKGINFIELIPAILFRFRFRKIGVISDIKKAFLQISLTENDRDFLRFFWYNENGELTIFRHARVVFGITCSPFLLGAVIDFHLRKCLEISSSKNTIRRLLDSFYIDNCVTSVDNEEELRIFIDEARNVMAEAKFDLRGWEHSMLDTTFSDSLYLSPVLGLKWNKQLDTLELASDWYTKIDSKVITKRTILSAAHQLFDPIGFSCPVSLYPKLLLQESWKSKIGWDTEVDDELKKKFSKWIRDLPLIFTLKISRWLGFSSHVQNKMSLHIFCDSSKYAYATVIYLRLEHSTGAVQVELVQAKSRVVPLKPISMPRKELLSASIGARLFTMFNKFIDIPAYFWSDSTTVLSWIKLNHRWKPYVWNRVEEIRKLTNSNSWFYVPSELNPADLPSRGCSPKQLLESRWWEGPSWLKGPPETWPDQNYSCDEHIVNVEKKKEIVSSHLNIEDTTKSYYWYHERISDYDKIVRVFGRVLRFIANCRHKSYKMVEKILSAEELSKAEIFIVKLVEEEVFTGGVDDLKLQSFSLILDEYGVIRLKTKVSEKEDSWSFRFPAVLPGKHPLVTKLVQTEHLKAGHMGVQTLLSRLRERFWIIHGRRSVRSILSKCLVCRRHNSKRLEVSPVALPLNRVRDASVFEIIGVDLAGPLISRSREKVWICLFTCAVYRAIHLELVSSLSTETFLQALRRFIARRGRPSIIYCDNGGNFVGSNNVLNKVDWNKICTHSSIQKIDWKFIPPTGSWWGGWWEVLIRVVKSILKKILGKASLTYEELYTVIIECEAIINSRPLTYISEDSKDLVPLTPAMFLQEIREIGVPDMQVVEANSLNRHYRYRERLKKVLRSRFRAEYLGQLALFSSGKPKSKIKVGTLLLVGNDTSKRSDWPLACVEELIPGRDGQVRLARLRTASGYLLRPLQRLYPLEVDFGDLKPKYVATSAISINTSESTVVRTRSGRETRKPKRFPSK